MPTFLRLCAWAPRGCALLLGFAAVCSSRAQFVFNESFSHSTFDQSGWIVASSNGTYAPTLTGGSVDADGSGWLRMTNNGGQQATYARLTTPIPSASNNITVDLRYQMWTPNAQGADGFTISLRDASVTNFDVGAFGGSLGYAQKNAAAPGGADTTHAGMAGGYFSVGVDAYGNFSNPTEGRQGGIGQTPNSIAVRGPGSGTGTDYNGGTNNNYAYINGTTNLSNTPYSLGVVNFTGANSRPVDGSATNDRELVFNFTTDNILTVSMRFGATGTLTQVFQSDLTTLGVRPENLELVFTAGTGGYMQYTDIKGLSITTSGAPVGNVFYSNYAGDNKWGNGNNWGNAATPNLGVTPTANANLIFSNHAFTNPSFQLTTAQNVDLGGNRSAGSIQFDAPFNYTLQGYTLTLDSGQGNTPTAITVTSAAPGGAHTIQSNLALGSDLNVNTNTGTALNISGSLAAGNHTITLNNNGTTTISGAIAGSGNITQTAASTGTLVLTGNSAASYTGDLAVQNGTIRLGNSNILSGATQVSLSTANSAGTFDLANHDQTLGGIAFVSGGTVQTGAGTLTLAGNVSTQASATTATISGNLNLGGSARTFAVEEGAAASDLTISAAIGGSGGVVKTGNGTLTLSGMNTHAGPNTFAAGTTIAASDAALGAGASTVANGATLGLSGNITLTSGAIAVSGTGQAGNAGAIATVAGDNTLAAAVTLAGNTTVGSAAGTSLTVSGSIGESAASALTANGSGTVVLSGANSYSGSTIVNAGSTLVAAHDNALGSTAAGTTVASGGTLGFTGGVNYTAAEGVTVSGTGAAGRSGAVDNIAGDNVFAGSIALAGNTTVGASAGTSLTLSGTIGGAGTLTAGGNGTVTLAGNNAYSGSTVVASGATLVAAGDRALGDTGASTTTTVASGGTLGLQGNIAIGNETIALNGTGSATGGALKNIAGNNTVATAVTLASSSTIDAAANSTLTLAGGIGGGAVNLTKSGDGTVVIGAAASYTGTTTVSGGTLALANNGSLASANNITVTNGTLALDNSAVNNGGRLSNSAAISLGDGALRFVGNAAANSAETFGTVTAASGANTVYLQADPSRQADVTISNLVQNGSATITFTTDPTATLGDGATSAGSLGSPRVFLNQINGVGTSGSLTAPVSLAGWILVNDANGSANFAEYTGGAGVGNGVRALTSYYTGSLGINVNQSNQSVLLTSSSPVGAYTLTNTGTTTDGNLKITDAALVNLGTSTSRTLQLNSGGLIKSGATTSTISGAGLLTTANGGTLAVTVDNAAGVLNIDSVIVNNRNRSNSPIALTKSGAGLLVLGGANTFTGNVNINAGTLRISAENGLGSTTATKTIALNGGTLNVTAGFTANTSKTWTIGANSSGTFDIDAGQTLALNGAGDLTSASTSQLVKTGAGVLRLGANNTTGGPAGSGFAGTALVNNGTLELWSANALGTNREIALAGGTLGLRSDTNNTTFANNITVTADSTVSANRNSTGTNLTLGLGTLAIGSNTLTTTGSNGYDLRFGNVALSGNTIFNTATAGSDLTLGAISGTGSITKSGAANLTLAAASAYDGATTVNAGTLLTQGANFLPTATALTIVDGAAVNTGNNSQTLASLAGGTGNATLNLGTGGLTVGDANSTTFGGAITAGTFTKVGDGTLTLAAGPANSIASFAIANGTVVASKSAGDATGSGAVAIGDGSGAAGTARLQLGAANQINDASAVTIASDGELNLAGYNETIGSLSGSGAVTLGAGRLTVAGNASTTFSGAIGGSGGITKAGSGTLVLSGASSYSGSTAIDAGTLRLESSNAVGSGAGGVAVASGATLEVQNNIDVANAALTLAGTGASGSGALRNVSGDNTWGGGVTLGAGGATIEVGSGNLYVGGSLATVGNTLTVSGAGNLHAGGGITGGGGVIKNGIGTLILGSSGNTYTGTTVVNSGSLQIDVDGAGPAASAVTLASSGSALNVNNHTATIGSLDGVDGSYVTLGSGSLTAGGLNTNATYSGAITGSGGSFAKTGSGTLTLGGSGSNTLSGTFSVADGTAVLAKTPTLDATGTGALVVGDGAGAAASAIVRLAGTDQINDSVAVTLNADGRLDLNGNNERVGSVASASGTASVTLGAGALFVGGNNSSTMFAGAISGSGAVTKEGAGTLTLTGANSFTGGMTVAGGTLVLGATNTLNTGTTVTVANGATLSVGSGISQIVAGLTTSTSSTLTIDSSATLTVNTPAGLTLLGSLTGTGTFAVTGGGNLTIGNNLTFGGTLAFGGTTIGGTPTTTLFLSTTVQLGTLHITGDTILDFGNSAATTLTATTLIIDPGVNVSVVNWVNATDYFVAQNFPGAVMDQRGNTPVPNNAATQVTFTGYTNNQTAWVSFDHEITPAPEPRTYGVLLIGTLIAWLAFHRYRRPKTAS